MPGKKPAPPLPERRTARTEKGAPIRDARAQFTRKGPQTAEERQRARAFIESKIEMVETDPTLSAAEKAAAIADLKAKQ